MNKKLAFASVAIAFFMMITAVGVAHGNDRGEAKATIEKAQVTVDYGRPSLNGRDVLKLISPGQIWRLGSDAPTTIDSSVDLDFGGTRVSKGKHILLARLLEAGKWTLVVSSKSAQQYEPSAKIAEIPMELQESSDPVDELTIKLTSDGGKGVMEVFWGSARLKATFAPAK